MSRGGRPAARRARRLIGHGAWQTRSRSLLAAAAARDPERCLAAHRRRHADVRRCGWPGRAACRAAGGGRAYAGATSSSSLRGPPRRTCSAGSPSPPSAPSPCRPILPRRRTSSGSRRPGPAATAGHRRGPAAAGRGGGRSDIATGLLDIDELVGDWRATRSCRRQAIPLDVTPDDLAVLIPTSGTTGRSKLVMQTQRAYAMAGEGFPYWMELTQRRPADDVAAAVPHQRTGLLGAGLAGMRSRPRPAAALLGERLPRRPRDGTARPSSTRSARCWRS